MANNYFKFKQFTIVQQVNSMKVTTDGCLFGAWVAAELANLKTVEKTLVDIGAGTGLLSLMIAQANKNLQINAVEIHEASAKECAANIAQSQFANITTTHANIVDYTPKQAYNFIVTNPPFYQNQLQSPNLQKNRAHHSNNLIWDDLFSWVSKYLAPDGYFFILLPYARLADAEDLCKSHHLNIYQKIIVQPTEQPKPFRAMLSITKKDVTTTVKNLTIKTNHSYTANFTKLLEPYYL
jgi:tRNA1Val (adenine37-N6)-methyltransferase